MTCRVARSHSPRRRRRAIVAPAALLLWLAVGCTTAAPRGARPVDAIATPAPAGCFDTTGSEPARRRLAEQVLLDAADGEALYTLADGLKPISSGRAFVLQVAPTVSRAGLDSLDHLREALTLLSCGEIGAFVHGFTAPQGDTIVRRSFDVMVYHRGAVARLIARHASFFGTLGITPAADVREVLAAVENAPRADRWRGYGLLFGYPEAAVDFFVAAGVEGDRTRALVPRDFRRIETWRKYPVERDGPPVASSFVYAVPKGAAESEGDRALREAAAPIYERYVRERARRITADSTGALALWRDWLRR